VGIDFWKYLGEKKNYIRGVAGGNRSNGFEFWMVPGCNLPTVKIVGYVWNIFTNRFRSCGD